MRALKWKRIEGNIIFFLSLKVRKRIAQFDISDHFTLLNIRCLLPLLHITIQEMIVGVWRGNIPRKSYWGWRMCTSCGRRVGIPGGRDLTIHNWFKVKSSLHLHLHLQTTSTSISNYIFISFADGELDVINCWFQVP